MDHREPYEGYREAEPYQGYQSPAESAPFSADRHLADPHSADPHHADPHHADPFRGDPYRVDPATGHAHAAPPYAPVPPPLPPVGRFGSTERNWMGIVGLVCALLVFAPLGIVFGHLGRAAIAQGRANNPGIATTALVLSYVFTALGLIALISV